MPFQRGFRRRWTQPVDRGNLSLVDHVRGRGAPSHASPGNPKRRCGRRRSDRAGARRDRRGTRSRPGSDRSARDTRRQLARRSHRQPAAAARRGADRRVRRRRRSRRLFAPQANRRRRRRDPSVRGDDGWNAERRLPGGWRAAAAAGTAGLAPDRRRRLDRGGRLGRGGRIRRARQRGGCCSRSGAASSRPLPRLDHVWFLVRSVEPPEPMPAVRARPSSCWPADPLRSTANAACWPGTASTPSSAATAAARPPRLSSPLPASSASGWSCRRRPPRPDGADRRLGRRGGCLGALAAGSLMFGTGPLMFGTGSSYRRGV